MADTNFFKQTTSEPLFPDLLWSRPENKLHAGKLLIIGGNVHGFAAPAEAYTQACKAGVGSAKVLLPAGLQKTIGAILENGEFAPSNKSGSFAREALAEWLDFSNWADATMIAGDLGRNSETAIVLEQFLSKTNQQLTITKDALDYLTNHAPTLFKRSNTTIVASLAQLQKLSTALGFARAVTFGMTVLQLADFLHDLTSAHPCNIVVRHNDIVFVACNGQVSATNVEPQESWRVQTAAKVSVWWLQNPSKTFEALTCAQIA